MINTDIDTKAKSSKWISDSKDCVCRLSFHSSIRVHGMHDGCDSGSNFEVARELFLLSFASNRATIDLRLTIFVCVVSATVTIHMTLLKDAGSIKISFKLPSNFLQNFISFKFPSFSQNFLQKGNFLESESTGHFPEGYNYTKILSLF